MNDPKVPEKGQKADRIAKFTHYLDTDGKPQTIGATVDVIRNQAVGMLRVWITIDPGMAGLAGKVWRQPSPTNDNLVPANTVTQISDTMIEATFLNIPVALHMMNIELLMRVCDGTPDCSGGSRTVQFKFVPPP
jgi:hypothetical protein